MTIQLNVHCETLETSHYSHNEKLPLEVQHPMSCESKQDGIYADYASDCKKFFVCEKSQMFNFDCPTSTRFYERFESCSFVPPEELIHFECNNSDQLEDLKISNQQSLHQEKQSSDWDEVDRRNDGVKKVQVFDPRSGRDMDYIKQDDGEEFFVMQPSEDEGENKYRKEKDEDESHPTLPFHPPQTYHAVPIKGHEYRDQHVLESLLSPLLKSKQTRVSKKLTPCQKAASSRRNDRKSKRFERSVKCTQ